MHKNIKWMWWGIIAARLGSVCLPVDAGADAISLSASRDILHATILGYADGRFHILLQNGRIQPTSISDVAKIEFGQPHRIASITTKDGGRVLVAVSSWEGGVFRGKDINGSMREISLSETKEAVFYPVSLFSKSLNVPYVEQKPDYCGEACVEMVTAFLGRRVSQDRVNHAAGLDGSRGAYGRELKIAIVKLGLKIPERTSWVGRSKEDFVKDRMRLLACLERNHPVLLGIWCDYKNKQNADIWAFDHFVVLVGYDLEKQCFIIHDPARKARWEVSFDEFVEHRRTISGYVYSIEFLDEPAAR